MADRQNPDRRAPETARESDETKKQPERNQQGICVDQRGQDQPADKERARENK